MNDEHGSSGNDPDELGLGEPDGVDLTSDSLPTPLIDEQRPADLHSPATSASSTAAAPTTKVYAGSGFRWSLVFGTILVAAIIVMVVQNTETVTFEFLTWSISAPLAAIVLGTTLIAVIIDEIVGYVIRVRRRRIRRKLDELKALKKQAEPQKERRFGRKQS